MAQAILKVCKEMIGATAGYVAVPSEDRANEKIDVIPGYHIYMPLIIKGP